MAKWLRQQRLRDMKCIVHDLEVRGSNTGHVKLGMHSTSVNAALRPKLSTASASVCESLCI